jgi:HTH-type transcriptional regulator / antitoxin HigA
MNIRPIRKNAGYEWALQEVEPYFKNPPAVGSEDADRLMFCRPFSSEDENFEIADADRGNILNIVGKEDQAPS